MPNPDVIDTVDPQSLARFDAIIDVRSPAEFAEDHVPTAINLPVLSNEERAIVGTIYVQELRFRARRVGAALVARNVAHHLETALADKPGSFMPLVYCWRGGQRSNAMAAILSQIGWRTAVLAGGYKSYRRLVQRRFYEDDLGFTLVLLDGGTGSGKTAILARLAAMGVQTLDLEALAEHRGSLFGSHPGRAQPSQKMFESRLLAAIEALEPARPVIVEAESSKIGDRMTPPTLWRAMLAAPRIEIIAPRLERARYLVRAYADVVANGPALETALARLPVHRGRKRLEDWNRLADAADFVGLAEALMERHYDLSYARSSRNDRRPKLGEINLAALDEPDLTTAAKKVAHLISTLG